ncbi:MAG: MbcA/ParS/Xre antitoxin family protein [Candidatus Cybelea sp.]
MRTPEAIEATALSATAVRAFGNIARAWDMDLREQRAALGNISKQTIYNWREHPERARLSGDQLDRVSFLLGIFKALHILFTRPEQADSWIRRPNAALPFGGRPAADLMFSGRIEDLIRVRRYVDGARGVW